MSDESEDEIVDIDLIRFAYDVFRYSASRFGVPEQVMPEWEGPENDYEDPDFISTVCRSVLEHQISLRQRSNRFIQNRWEQNMSCSRKHICEALSDVINFATADQEQGSMTMLEFSLSAACELILFLYSKNLNLFPIQLAEHWFHYYLKRNIRKFNRLGGLYQLYIRGINKTIDLPDFFMDTFIFTFCRNYQTSVNMDLHESYFNSKLIYKQKNQETYSSEPHYEVVEQDEDSEVDLPPNPGLGVPLPQEMYDFDLTDASALTQNLREESGQELSKRPRRPTYRERRLNRNLGSHPIEEQGLGQFSLDSSETKQSREENSNVSISTETTQSCEHYGAKPKCTVRNRKSSDLQTGKSSLRLNVEHCRGHLRLDSLETKQSSEENPSVLTSTDTTQSYENLGTKPRNTVGNRKSSDLQAGESSLSPSLEQVLGQLNLDSSGTKQSSEKKSDILAADDLTSQNHPTKERSGSSSEEETAKMEIQE